MRSADEQLRTIRVKAHRLRQRRQNLVRAGASVCGLLLVVILALALPRVSGNVNLPEGAVFGSLVLASPVRSYVVVAILAFALGICVTLLCVYRRPRPAAEEDET